MPLGYPKYCMRFFFRKGMNTQGMNASQIHEILGSHEGFINKKSLIKRYLVEEKKHIVYFLPKFYLELNTIEQVWIYCK